KSAKVPLYRALYIDKLLEEHDTLYSTRDRVYRGLVRNFKTVRDSESEPPEKLAGIMRPYQVLGFKWIRTLEEAGFGGILADEMGLGKTLQTISVLLYDYEEKKPGTEHPSLVVCPASLVYNWQEEFEKFAPDMRVMPVTGGAASRKKAFAAWDTTQVYIISYDLLKRNIAEFSGKEFFYAVLDEAQAVKNSGAAVSKAVKTLNAAHRIALTGTPIENRLSELWSIFDFLMPGFLYSQKEFEQRFAVPVTKNKDQEAVEKLKKMTSPFLMRRRKEDVLKDLPAKLEEVRYVPISGEQQKLYDAQVLKLRNSILDGTMENGTGKVKVLAELTKIREICCDPSLLYEDYHEESGKREAVMGLIRQAMDGGHRMLLFSQFTSMLALLERDLKAEGIPYYILTGATSKEKRIQLVHQFNEGNVPVFLISLKAGGNGLNLTGADIVIHYDPWWNFAAQNQATDRAHRIGQTRQVTVYRLILKGTIEERILKLQEEKKDLADQVLSGESASLASLSQEELLELLG
ncbi:MAG: SNF2 family helicase, partial [Lachnospiraceae bacterium]|nr:SNF2 family helicase [Lachnospiraceae bacterium]